MNTTRPRVSIGMPVYNGEQFIVTALDSILGQIFGDFELIISDNASTDRTGDICRAYAARDGRVKYFRNTENIGGMRNANRVFELSSGEYFKWTAHDDVLAPTNLQRCVSALDADPSAVLCFCNARFIDERGNTVGSYEVPLDCEGLSRTARFRRILNLPTPCHGIMTYGLLRASAMRRTRLLGQYFEWDQVLIVEMSLLGSFVKVPEQLYTARKHPGQGSRGSTWKHRALWMDPSYGGGYWRTRLGMIWERFVGIKRSDLRWYEKGLCYFYMCGFAQRTLRRRLVLTGWNVWSQLKLKLMAASRYTCFPLRLWALARFLRSAGLAKLGDGIRNSAGMTHTELVCTMARAVLKERNPNGQKMMTAWLEEPAEIRRLAATRAMGAYLNECKVHAAGHAGDDEQHLAGLLRSRLRVETSKRVLHVVVEALLQRANPEDDAALAERRRFRSNLDAETIARLEEHFKYRPAYAPVAEAVYEGDGGGGGLPEAGLELGRERDIQS